MAILKSDLAELEIRVLWAWRHGQGYAIDLRWNGRSVLNPDVVRRTTTEAMRAPEGWLYCEGREYALLSDLFLKAATLKFDRCHGWFEPRYRSGISITVRRCDPGDYDEPCEVDVCLRHDAARFDGAVLISAELHQAYERLRCDWRLGAELDAIVDFGVALGDEIAAALQDSERRKAEQDAENARRAASPPKPRRP